MEDIRIAMENAFYTGLSGRIGDVVTEKKVVKTASVKEQETPVTSHDVRDAMSDAFCESLDTNIKLAEVETQKMIKKASTKENLPIRKVIKADSNSKLKDLIVNVLGANLGSAAVLYVVPFIQNKLIAAGFSDANVPAAKDIKDVYERNKAQLMSSQGKESLQQGAAGFVANAPIK